MHRIIPSSLPGLDSLSNFFFLEYYITVKKNLPFSPKTGRSVSLIQVYVNNGCNQVGLPL